MEDFGAPFNFSADKLELLAQMLEEAEIEVLETRSISQRPCLEELPLSFAQQRLWFIDQLMPHSPAYNIPAALHFTGALNISALEQSINEIVRRHEALRATFGVVNGHPVQTIRPVLRIALPLIDLRSLPQAEQEAEVARLISDEARRPFDLQHSPLLRAGLIQLAADEHIFLLTMHHIVSDGWSIGVFKRELIACYRAFTANRPVQLPDLPLQYVDFAYWQRQWLQGSILEDQLAYWTRQLGNQPLVLQLPTDRPRPAVQTFRGGRQSIAISQELTLKLKALSQQEGATLFMTLMAAFQTLLSRYSGQSDIAVGTPIANRTQVETEALIGFFVNTLVLRSDVQGHLSFRELLRHVREVCLDAYAHQDLPFEQLMEVLQPARNLSYNPLFQVMFALQTASEQDIQLDGLRLRALPFESGTAKFDLTFDIVDTGAELLGSLDYSTDLFDAATITRMLAHFETLLASIVACPDHQIARLPLLTEAEQQLLLQWNTTGSRNPSNTSLHALFEAQVEATPDAVAVVYEQEQVTYRELNQRANQLAHHLHTLGVGSETLVALCLERSIAMVVSIIGVLKAGGAYVPLDPAQPKERLAFMLRDMQAPVLLTQASLVEHLPEHSAQVVCIDTDWPTIGQALTINPAPIGHADHLAYVIYTSGSTGKPKGTLICHDNVIRLFTATHHWFQFSDQDVWTLFHSYAFDFSVWEFWGALLYGGRLVVVPYLVSRSPEAFYELLVEQRVTVLNQTPSAFRQLMRVDQDMSGVRLDQLRWVIFGGEALDLHSLKPWFARHGDRAPQLINMYGITETTVHVTYYPITAADAEAPQGSRIGVPIPDLQLYVLDQYQNMVPVGVPGELYVGGSGLGRGYLNRPELTEQRFIPHPWSTTQHARLYKTGDLVRYLADGSLEYLGRIDQQVKIRGFRIELGEIEAALKSHPAVQEVVVLAQTNPLDDKQLAAYIVPRDNETPSVDALRRWLKPQLPEYMVPSFFVMLDALPLTINGKIDYRALPMPTSARPALEHTYTPPTTQVEALLAEVWAEVLGIQQIGIHDNFFALGGDSIRSIRVLALAKQKGMHCSLQQLFQYQTIYELGQELQLDQTAVAVVARTEPFSLVSDADRLLLPAGLEDAYPLTMLQLGMIYHMHLRPEHTTYHNVDSFHLRGRFDLDALRAAVDYVVARHPILRTSFDLTSYSEPLQMVHPTAVMPIEADDLRHLPVDQQDAAIAQFCEGELQRRFDLSHPPMLRFHFHRRTDDTFQFTLTECHVILDGWSLTSTIAEVFTYYLALIDQAPPPNEPPLTLAFRDFVLLERMALESEAAQRYWTEKLHDHTVTKMPRWPQVPEPGASKHRVRHLHPQIGPDVSAGLHQLARSAGVPIKSVLLAAHLKVMSLLSGQRKIVTGLVCNGRPEEVDGERIRGLFLNTVPFCVKLASTTWMDLVRETFKAEQELLPFRRYPMPVLQKQLGGAPLFEIMFNFVHFHAVADLIRSGNFEILGSTASEETNFTLMVGFSLDLITSEVLLVIDWDTTVLHEAQMLAVGGYYAAVLQSMATDPAVRHDLWDWLSLEERRQQLVTWNQTAQERSPDQGLHELFKAQAARTPDAQALVYEDQCLTYRELDERTDQLACYLRTIGVQPETLVAVCMERSLEMVISLLGVLKAGGAYVPIDPSYPAERLRFMLADANAPVLLTQQRLADNMPVPSAQVVCVDTAWDQIVQQFQATAAVTTVASNMAYMIYTSGSTGQPKGAMNTHEAIVNRLLWMQGEYRLDASDRILQKTPFSFDVSVWEFFWPLITGATLVVARPGGHQDSAYLVNLIADAGITTLHFVPSMLQVFLEERGLERCQSLRRVVCSGEALPLALQERFFERVPHAELHNLYGPTEAAVDVTYWACQRDSALQTLPIGRPVANTQIYLLDSSLNPVPVGVPGELHIGGIQLARGYLNRPDLTAERFIPDPFNRAGGRLYKTGDLARYLPDGAIEYLGRLDFQVKVRGFRIELGEIEAVLRLHPDVQDITVLAVEDGPGSKRLVAYLVSHAAQRPTVNELRSFVQEKLPEYMTPAVFIFLDALPLSPNGKINRHALPKPEATRPELDVAYVAPRTQLEQTIAALWQEVLHVEKVGLYDNVFELGGDSIKLIRVHTKLQEALGKELPMTVLFKHPSVNALAKYLNQEQTERPSFQRFQDRAKQQKAALSRQSQAVKGRKKPNE